MLDERERLDLPADRRGQLPYRAERRFVMDGSAGAE